MHKRKYKIISFILAAVLFLAGVYPDIVIDNAVFQGGSVGKTAFSTKSFRTRISNLDICGREILNEGSEIRQRPAGLYPFLSLPRLNRILPLRETAFRRPEAVQPFCQTMDGLVTIYMHQSDGKK